MTDTDTLSEPKKKKGTGDDFPSMTADLFSNINFKAAIFLFMIGILIFSDVFIENILSSFSGASASGEATTKGTVIQLFVLVLGYLIIDLLIQGGCV